MFCFVVSSPVSGCMAFRLQNLNPALIVRQRMLHLGCCFILLLCSYMKSLLPAQPPAVLLWCSIEMLIKPPQERADSSKRKKSVQNSAYITTNLSLDGSSLYSRPHLSLERSWAVELVAGLVCLNLSVMDGVFFSTANQWTVLLGVKNRVVACIPRLVCTYMAFTHTKLKHSVI